MDRQTQAREMRKLTAAPDVMLESVQALTESGQLVAVSATGSQMGPYSGRFRRADPRRWQPEDRPGPGCAAAPHPGPGRSSGCQRRGSARILIIECDFRPGHTTVVSSVDS